MNLLIFSGKSIHHKNKAIGGAEVSLGIISEELNALGENVFYLTSGLSSFPQLKKRIINGVTFYFFSPFKWPHNMLPFFGKYYFKFISFQKIIIVAYLALKHKVDLIYSFPMTDNTFEAIRARNFFKLKLKIVLRAAGLRPAEDTSTSFFKMRTVFENIDAINFQSIFHKHSYINLLNTMNLPSVLKPEIICDIGIHRSYFQYPRNSKPNKPLHFLCACRFSFPKRQDIIIDALKDFSDRNFKITFVGEGENLSQCKKLVNDFKLTNFVTFSEFLSRDELMSLMIDSTCLLHPVDYEPQSKLVWESMAIRLPVICSNVRTLNDIIVHKHTGILVNNNISDWKNAITDIAVGKYDLKHITDNAYQYVCEVADSRKNAKFYQKQFYQILNRK